MGELKDLQTRITCLRRTLYSSCEELSEALHEIQLLLAAAKGETPTQEKTPQGGDTPVGETTQREGVFNP